MSTWTLAEQQRISTRLAVFSEKMDEMRVFVDGNPALSLDAFTENGLMTPTSEDFAGQPPASDGE